MGRRVSTGEWTPRERARPGARGAALCLVLLPGALAACEDPTNEAAVAAQGPEEPAVPPGPLHRPGQPCLVCHDGETGRAFSLAGTVFWAQGSDIPATATEVLVLDDTGARFTAVTNCAGNFFVRPEEYEPVFPLWVALRRGKVGVAMDSPARGEGSCAGCHGLEAGPTSAGRVYLHGIEPADGPGGCP